MSTIEFIKPSDIERRSFEIIEDTLKARNISVPLCYGASGEVETDAEILSLHKNIIYRCIHTTADFDYASTLKFSNGSVDIIRKLLKDGADIITDTNMALTGINKKKLHELGGEAYCLMADADLAREAKERELTRAYVAMEHAARREMGDANDGESIDTGNADQKHGLHKTTSDKPLIFAIGNAPTALISLHNLYTSKTYTPDFIIGVPVGFVNVVASKELIMNTDIPYIINNGNKGGSPVAAAIVNAILYSL